MPFTATELENIANASLEYYFKRGTVYSQTIQDKPLFKWLRGKQKTFPGGKDNISVRVKGVYTSKIEGFQNDDRVSYSNPGNIRRAVFPWKLIHEGIQFTKHEMVIDGVSIVDTTTAKPPERNHSEREKTALANLLEDKMEDMKEGWDRSSNLMFWRDGTQDATLVPGVRSFILDDPTTATVVGGIDQSTNTWWRNRANVAIAAAPANAADQTAVQTLQKEFRQLRRYGSPDHHIFAGSDFMDQFERELRSKGNYTLEGWAKNGGRIDASVADLAFKGKPIEYDPTLDDEGQSKYCYVLDGASIMPMVVEGEDMVPQYPARPENQYIYHRAMTWVGGLICKQRNTSGVYKIN